MTLLDILYLSLRNLREAKLRAILTTMGVIVGVAVIVTMVSFGLGLQRNTTARFKELDLFNEITVFGRSLASIAANGFGVPPANASPGASPDASPAATASNGSTPDAAPASPNASPSPGASASPQEMKHGERYMRPDKAPERALDDAAIAEIAKIPGVAYVEPTVSFSAYVRSNNRAQTQSIGGAIVPNPSSRFKEFTAGGMIAAPNADEAVVDDRFLRDFGYAKPSDAIGQRLDLLAPKSKDEVGAMKDEGVAKERGDVKGAKAGPDKVQPDDEEEDVPNFFGIPLADDEGEKDTGEGRLVARSFRIVGVLKSGENGAPRFRGMLPAAGVYVPLAAARGWTLEHRDVLGQVALQLARESGKVSEDEESGYGSAVVRVTDPVVLTDVRKRLTELGFGSFSIVDQLEQLRTVFLIMNSVLGLLGGISLLVASFGIANTMIMSILERTREIGIMKAVGAEDREIKLIFFVEAAVIGLAGGILGSLAAWGIDAVANRLAYRFILKPQGANFIDFFALPPYLWLGAILFAVAISIIAALYPAARAARIDPVLALRHD
jgi:ABC-type antimicrobial peptide transport system permease subunit